MLVIDIEIFDGDDDDVYIYILFKKEGKSIWLVFEIYTIEL